MIAMLSAAIGVCLTVVAAIQVRNGNYDLAIVSFLIGIVCVAMAFLQWRSNRA